MVNVENILSSAFKYALDIKKMTLYFILSLVLIISVAVSILTITSVNLSSFLIYFSFLCLILFIICLASLYVEAVITHNAGSKKKQTLSQSSQFIKSKYLTLLACIVIIFAITMLVEFVFAFVPLLPALIDIIIGLAFFFVVQSVILGNNGCEDSLKESYNIFMKNKLNVFVYWIILAFVTGIMAVIAFVPFFISLIPIISEFVKIMASSQPNVTQLFMLAKSNTINIFIGSIVSAFLLSFVQVFQTAAKSLMYNEIKYGKRKNN